MVRKKLSALLALAMILTTSVSALAESQKTASTIVTYIGTDQTSYIVTVPANMKPGDTGTVTVEGQWPLTKTLHVTADPEVIVTNEDNINSRTLEISFDGISKTGDNANAISATDDGASASVTVTEMTGINFGDWSGSFDYYISFEENGTDIFYNDEDLDPNIDYQTTSFDAETAELLGLSLDGDLTIPAAFYVENSGAATMSLDAIDPEQTNGTWYKVTSIAEKGFYGCETLKTVTMPSTVGYIAPQAFEKATALEKVIFPKNSILGEISAYAFADCNSLTSINLPDTVTYILDNAFSGTALESINIPKNVTTISTLTFNGCNKLTEVNLHNNITKIETEAFGGCTSLKNITLNNNITFIGDFAFNKCTSLTNVNIPTSLKTISKHVFYDCDALQTIDIPDNITTIGESAFAQCDNLTTVNITNTSQLIKIDESAFSDCGKLLGIYIPNTVTSIGGHAFSECTALEAVYFEDNSTLKTIGDWTFLECDSLTAIDLPDSITSIGELCFYSCSKLSSVTFGENPQITIIPKDAFENCPRLTSIDIPDSVTTIGEYAFNCCQFTQISFGANSQLTTIEKNAFMNMETLRTINLPHSITTIGNSIISAFTPLETVNYDGTKDDWAKVSIDENNTALLNATINFLRETTPPDTDEETFDPSLLPADYTQNSETEFMWSGTDFCTQMTVQCNMCYADINQSHILETTTFDQMRQEINAFVTEYNNTHTKTRVYATEHIMDADMTTMGMMGTAGCNGMSMTHDMCGMCDMNSMGPCMPGSYCDQGSPCSGSHNWEIYLFVEEVQ